MKKGFKVSEAKWPELERRDRRARISLAFIAGFQKIKRSILVKSRSHLPDLFSALLFYCF
jgi:hypothetical protein